MDTSHPPPAGVSGISAQNGPPADGLLDELAHLWSRAFAGAPWHATRDEIPQRRTVIERQLARRSSRCLLSRHAGAIAGAGWTWAGDDTPDDDLHRAIRAAVSTAEESWMFAPSTRVLVELMVDPADQGRGHGSRLLAALTESDSWLLTHPDGVGVALYRRHGWRTCVHIDHHNTPLDVMHRQHPRGVVT